MKFQLAIDLHGIPELIELSKKINDTVDIIEVGTPILMLEGLHSVSALREILPTVKILADTKIVDGASLETQYAIDAGADIVTVLAVADDKTIQDCIETAHKSNKEVLVDLINVKNIAQRAQQIDAMGADYISVHTASDVQSEVRNPLNDLKMIINVVKNAKISCAGGINFTTIEAIKSLNPDVVIIGSAICNHDDPKTEAQKYSAIIKEG